MSILQRKDALKLNEKLDAHLNIHMQVCVQSSMKSRF